MWSQLYSLFSSYPAQRQVARKMIELGLSINKNGKIYCGDVEVKEKSLAIAAGTDRRIIRSTIVSIQNDPFLFDIFCGIKPAGSLLTGVAHKLGFGVVELEADAKKPAIIAKAATLLSDKNISIRQMYAKDPELFEKPSLIIITNRSIPGELIMKFSKIQGVKKVSVI